MSILYSQWFRHEKIEGKRVQIFGPAIGEEGLWGVVLCIDFDQLAVVLELENGQTRALVKFDFMRWKK